MPSDTRDSLAELSAEWARVARQWNDARGLWRDAAASRFELEYWRDWNSEVTALLNDLRKACEDW